jgi:hypothetical protein
VPRRAQLGQSGRDGVSDQHHDRSTRASHAPQPARHSVPAARAKEWAQIRVATNQCTGNPQFQGDQDADVSEAFPPNGGTAPIAASGALKECGEEAG